MLEFDYKDTHFLVNNKILLDKKSSKMQNTHYKSSLQCAFRPNCALSTLALKLISTIRSVFYATAISKESYSA